MTVEPKSVDPHGFDAEPDPDPAQNLDADPDPDPGGGRSAKNAVFRIHNIMVWIRIRGSMPLTNGSRSGFGSGSCYFRHRPSRYNKKQFFYFISSAYYFLKIHLHLFQRSKIQKESQNSKNQGFSYNFCMMIEGSRSGSGSIPLTKDPDPDPGGPKTCGSGSGTLQKCASPLAKS